MLASATRPIRATATAVPVVAARTSGRLITRRPMSAMRKARTNPASAARARTPPQSSDASPHSAACRAIGPSAPPPGGLGVSFISPHPFSHASSLPGRGQPVLPEPLELRPHDDAGRVVDDQQRPHGTLRPGDVDGLALEGVHGPADVVLALYFVADV